MKKIAKFTRKDGKGCAFAIVRHLHEEEDFAKSQATTPGEAFPGQIVASQWTLTYATWLPDDFTGTVLGSPYVNTEAEAFKWHSVSQARAQARTYRERGFPCEVLPWKG